MCFPSRAPSFFLLQSEDGNLYKVTIEHKEEEVKWFKIKHFDTVGLQFLYSQPWFPFCHKRVWHFVSGYSSSCYLVLKLQSLHH